MPRRAVRKLVDPGRGAAGHPARAWSAPIFAVTLRGLQNDVYLQIGLLTTMGLTAKNAILMVEFAERAEKEGKRVHRSGDRGRAHPACGRS